MGFWVVLAILDGFQYLNFNTWLSYNLTLSKNTVKYDQWPSSKHLLAQLYLAHFSYSYKESFLWYIKWYYFWNRFSRIRALFVMHCRYHQDIFLNIWKQCKFCRESVYSWVYLAVFETTFRWYFLFSSTPFLHTSIKKIFLIMIFGLVLIIGLTKRNTQWVGTGSFVLRQVGCNRHYYFSLIVMHCDWWHYRSNI